MWESYNEENFSYQKLRCCPVTLDKHHTKAIFFEIGSSAKAHHDLLKYTFEHREAIGNHTWGHIDLRKVKPDQVDDEINKTREIIKQLIGTAPTFCLRFMKYKHTQSLHLSITDQAYVLKIAI
jgi:hypothetical protein